MSRAHADTTGRRWWAIDPSASLAQRGRRSSPRAAAAALLRHACRVTRSAGWVMGRRGAMNGNGDRSLAALAQLTLNRHRDQLDDLLEEEGEGRDDLARGAYLLLRARSLARTSAMSDALPLPVRPQRLRLHCPTLEDTRQVRDRYHALAELRSAKATRRCSSPHQPRSPKAHGEGWLDGLFLPLRAPMPRSSTACPWSNCTVRPGTTPGDSCHHGWVVT
jgi:hypothetical protein